MDLEEILKNKVRVIGKNVRSIRSIVFSVTLDR